jgi:hypothetical protein
MAKKYDMAVKTGSYEKNGETKNKWQNIGVVIEGQYGPYILLNRSFNPAGIPCDPNSDVITVSLFTPNSNAGKPKAGPVNDDEMTTF